ncbi:MAG: PilZ domain-containing protein [Bacillota bacterium]
MNASVVPTILSEGMMIGVRIGQDAPWHGNIIYEVIDNQVKIAYIDKSVKKPVIPGTPVWVKYSNDYFIYYFCGEVKSVSMKPPESITLVMNSVVEFINNRLYPRYDVMLKAFIRPVWDDTSYECLVTDISYGGAAFICNKKFDANENIEMSLYLPNGTVLKITGKVIRRRYSWDDMVGHAVQFIECDNESNKHLSEYFARLEDEIAEIYHRYKAESGESRQ